jgi:DNA-binding MarR family transcriptional regulator
MLRPPAATGSRTPSACTCARLRRLTRRMTALYDRELASTGLKLTQFSLLATLRREVGEAGIAISDLAAAMDMDRTTLTRNLRPLLDQGLVAFGASGSDARVRRVAITAGGLAAFDAARPRWRVAQDFVNRTLGVRNVAALHDWLDRVTPAFRVRPTDE